MATSQNGWTVDRTGSSQDRTAVAGVTFPNGVRRGDVATVLHYVARRFHAEVEPLRPGWCWGWYVKVIEGSTSTSNHASGTAIDLNAPDHPIGKRDTFSAAKRAKIRKILADCDGVVRWGGDYVNRPDDMHWEIVKGSGAVAALADKIKELDMPTPKEYAQAVVKELDATMRDPKAPLRASLPAAVFAHKIQLPPTTGFPKGREVTAEVVLEWISAGEEDTRDRNLKAIDATRERVLKAIAELGEHLGNDDPTPGPQDPSV